MSSKKKVKKKVKKNSTTGQKIILDIDGTISDDFIVYTKEELNQLKKLQPDDVFLNRTIPRQIKNLLNECYNVVQICMEEAVKTHPEFADAEMGFNFLQNEDGKLDLVLTVDGEPASIMYMKGKRLFEFLPDGCDIGVFVDDNK